MCHVRFVAEDSRGRFLTNPRGMENWSRDLSKARIFKTKGSLHDCIDSDTTKPSVKRRFQKIRRVALTLCEPNEDDRITK
jgi:hypothetical protein